MNIDIQSIDFSKNNIHKRFDQSFITRYTIVTEIVKEIKLRTPELKGKSVKILDLGGYNGAARYLLADDHVTILDVFEDDTLEDYIRVDSVGIPTEDNVFDIVISTDTLEHISAEYRERFVIDAVRVAKYATIIAAPFELSSKALASEELYANSVYVGATKSDYVWLQEHRDYHLPSRQWIESLIVKHNYAFSRFSHSNVRLWGELITIGFFIANNIAAADAKMALGLKRLNARYFKTIAAVDFPDDGYRSIYVISKKYKDITVSLPVYDSEKIDSFVAECRNTLGKVIARMSKEHSAANESISDLHERLRALDVENERLRGVERRYKDVTRSRLYRIAKQIKQSVKKIT